MVALGLTGGVGMGKSTAAEYLHGRGLPVIDTDVIARQVTEPGQPALAEILGAFGDQLVDEDGHLHRAELARLVFSDPIARARLEAILHPRIRTIWLAQIESLRQAGVLVAVVAIPLLFETNAAPHFTHTLCVACTAATQNDRLRSRGWTEQHLTQRIQAQLPIEQKIQRADFVVWTDLPLEIHHRQLDRILAHLP